jgi:O-antigen ligase
VIIVVIIGIAAGFVIIPWLDDISGGMLIRRYTDIDLSTRELLVNADFNLFLKNPILGVGPGMGFYLREGVRMAAAHTEYTRLLSEHGAFGILALVILVVLLIKSYFNKPDVMSRAWMVALAAWPLVEMAHSAMRVVSISFLLGMAVMDWQKDSQESQTARLRTGALR